MDQSLYNSLPGGSKFYVDVVRQHYNEFDVTPIDTSNIVNSNDISRFVSKRIQATRFIKNKSIKMSKDSAKKKDR